VISSLTMFFARDWVRKLSESLRQQTSCMSSEREQPLSCSLPMASFPAGLCFIARRCMQGSEPSEPTEFGGCSAEAENQRRHYSFGVRMSRSTSRCVKVQGSCVIHMRMWASAGGEVEDRAAEASCHEIARIGWWKSDFFPYQVLRP
jgi:hypothetical protein